MSASLMIMVLALGMSNPLSMIVVATRMSASFLTNATIAFSSSVSVIRPWAIVIFASGTMTCTSAAMSRMSWTRLWTK